MNYKEVQLRAKIEDKIDKKVCLIKTQLETLHNLYKVFTKELTGKTYDVFDQSVVDYKKVLSLKGLKFKVIEHGFSRAFFLTYKKPTFLWFSNKKAFYFVKGYSFYAEYSYYSTRYDFLLSDYNYILEVLKIENEKLQEKINNVRENRLIGEANE